MRILVLTHNYPRAAGDPAGAFIARLASAVSRAGLDVRVVVPHSPGAPEREDRDGVHVVRARYAPDVFERVGYTGVLHRASFATPMTALMLPVYLAMFVRAARAEARAFAPDVVHAHWWIPAGWVASMLGPPFVVTCHGSDVRLLETRRSLRPLARRVLRRAAMRTAVSRFLAADLQRLLGDERAVDLSPMPLDIAHFARGRDVPKTNPARILYAGNLVSTKGVDVLLDAVARLRGAGIVCELRIVGEGPEGPRLRAQAERLALGDVQWPGNVSQERMPAEYGAATVTVLTSRGQAEGLGLTLVEALLAGSAVVGSPAGGIPEVVIDGETGLIARDGDADDLARQIRRLLDDPSLRARLIARGQSHVLDIFSPDAITATWIQRYESIRAHRHDR